MFCSEENPSSTDLGFRTGVEIVKGVLAAHPGRKPTAADIARALGVEATALRRQQYRHCAPRIRNIVSYACVRIALDMIRDDVKVEAALWTVGLKNRTNFNRQCRRYFGTLPSLERQRHISEGIR